MGGWGEEEAERAGSQRVLKVERQTLSKFHRLRSRAGQTRGQSEAEEQEQVHGSFSSSLSVAQGWDGMMNRIGTEQNNQ
eukprot:scaffold3296_cov159-Ochromonas_danica.AAC.3